MRVQLAVFVVAAADAIGGCSSWNEQDVCPAARGLLSEAALQRLACESESWRHRINGMLEGAIPPPHGGKMGLSPRQRGGMGMTCPKCRFAVWMPTPRSACNMTSFGRGDGAKLMCGLQLEPRGGTVLSIGSRGDVSFERSVLERTLANVEIFDCTISSCSAARGMQSWRPGLREGRLRFHPICLGATDDVSKVGGALRRDWQVQQAKSAAFLSYPSIVAHLGIGGPGRPVAAVKMDIEGFEWSILESLLAAAAVDPSVPLPSQIAFELHLRTQMAALNWTNPFKEWQDVAHLSRAMYDAGYRTVSDVFNTACGVCTEYTMLRVFCPRGAGRTVAASSTAVEQAPWGADDPSKGCDLRAKGAAKGLEAATRERRARRQPAPDTPGPLQRLRRAIFGR